MLDFLAIKSDEEFEMLCEDLLKCKGFEIITRPSRGNDQGADIIAQTKLVDALGCVETLRILVECKHYAKSNRSVREDQLGNIIERTMLHNCNRYLLITSTLPSASVRNQLESITRNPVIRIGAVFWAKNDLSSLVNQYPELIEKYFSDTRNSKANPGEPGKPKINICIHAHPDFSEELNVIFRLWNMCQNHAVFIPIKPAKQFEQNLLASGEIDEQDAANIAQSIREEAGFTADDYIIQFCEKRLFCSEYYQLFSSGTNHLEIPPNTATISLKIMRQLSRSLSDDKNKRSDYDKPVLLMILDAIIHVIAEGIGLESHEETRKCVMDFDENMSDILYNIEDGPSFCSTCERQLMRVGSDFLIVIARITKKHFDTVKVSNRLKHKLDFRENMHKRYGDDYTYDVALSFAAEDREIAESLANKLCNLGIRIFYDNFEGAKLWDQDLYTYLSYLYRLRAKYCIMLISEHYSEKLWTNHGRKAAQERAFKENRPYILPLKIDDTDAPDILSANGYLRIDDNNIDEIAMLVKEKMLMNEI